MLSVDSHHVSSTLPTTPFSSSHGAINICHLHAWPRPHKNVNSQMWACELITGETSSLEHGSLSQGPTLSTLNPFSQVPLVHSRVESSLSLGQFRVSSSSHSEQTRVRHVTTCYLSQLVEKCAQLCQVSCFTSTLIPLGAIEVEESSLDDGLGAYVLE